MFAHLRVHPFTPPLLFNTINPPLPPGHIFSRVSPTLSASIRALVLDPHAYPDRPASISSAILDPISRFRPPLSRTRMANARSSRSATASSYAPAENSTPPPHPRSHCTLTRARPIPSTRPLKARSTATHTLHHGHGAVSVLGYLFIQSRHSLHRGKLFSS